MTDDPLRRAAFNRFLDEPHTIPAMAAHQPPRATREAINACPIERFFPTPRRVRKALLAGGPYIMSSRVVSPEVAAIFARTVAPAIRDAARAGHLLDFGHIPNRAFAAAAPEAITFPHPHVDWIGLHEFELGRVAYFVRAHPDGFEAFEIRAVMTPERTVALLAGDSAIAKPNGSGGILTGTASTIKGLTAKECTDHAAGNVVWPVLLMLTALADPRCGVTQARNFGHRVDTGPLIAAALDA